MRLLFRASGTFAASSLTTVIGLNGRNELAIDATHRRFWEDVPLELSLLAATVIDFGDESVRMGVRDAFYGLKKSGRQNPVGNPYLAAVRHGLADLVHLVRSPAEGGD